MKTKRQEDKLTELFRGQKKTDDSKHKFYVLKKIKKKIYTKNIINKNHTSQEEHETMRMRE